MLNAAYKMEVVNLDNYQEATSQIELENCLESEDHLAKCCF